MSMTGCPSRSAGHYLHLPNQEQPPKQGDKQVGVGQHGQSVVAAELVGAHQHVDLRGQRHDAGREREEGTCVSRSRAAGRQPA